jgi:ribonuclease Z
LDRLIRGFGHFHDTCIGFMTQRALEGRQGFHGSFRLGRMAFCVGAVLKSAQPLHFSRDSNQHTGAQQMRFFSGFVSLLLTLVLGLALMPAQAAPCMIVSLTGTQSGPPAVNGLAGAGTLVRYGDDSNDCNTVRLQFDAGRGTTMRLSQLGVSPGQVTAIFFTHVHSDHADGFADLAQLRWNFNSSGPKLDVVCADDMTSALGFTLSYRNLVAHIGDAYLKSGEIAQRRSEDKSRLPGGPADVLSLKTFMPTNNAQGVWSLGDVKVSAIRSTHITGHASYRVDTPAGSVVIGGDAGNDVVAPPRDNSTSAQVERLAQGADIVVHSTMHPAMGPDRDSGMPADVFHRQSLVGDLGAMAKRTGAKHLMLTHMAPPLGALRHGPYKVPGGPFTQADYLKVVLEAGFAGNVVVGTDLASVRLPAK